MGTEADHQVQLQIEVAPILELVHDHEVQAVQDHVHFLQVHQVQDLFRPQIRTQTKRSRDLAQDMKVHKGEKCVLKKAVRNTLNLILKQRKSQKLNANPKKDP